MLTCSDRAPGEQMRRGGRRRLGPNPRADNVTVRLDPDSHDAACRKAIREGSSVSEVIREALRKDLGLTI